jgi:hypothetical protein
MSSSISNFSQDLKEAILGYLRSDSPGGKQVIGSFLEQFEKLSARSPINDPTNISKHMNFIVGHLKNTWDESLHLTDDGNLEVGLGKDDVLGFTEDRSKLKHTPTPVAWLVYLIRGIGGRYAFVSPEMYAKKMRKPMPAIYNGGFLISRHAWEREGWYNLGPFETFEHPASGASPVPIFKDAMENVDIQAIISEAISEFKKESK